MTVINNYTTWLALLQLVNVQQNGQIPPSVFNTWYNECNKQVFKDLAEQFQLNQVLSDLLYPFRSIRLLPITPLTGQNCGLISYPSDYQYFVGGNILMQKDEEECFSMSNLPLIDNDGTSKRYIDPDYAQAAVNYSGANTTEGQLQLIDASRWPDCLNHITKGPTYRNPKMTQYSGGFKVAPKGIASTLLYYLHTPADSVFAYTISNDDILIYNAAGSTQLEWSDQVLPWFLALLVMKYGLYINSTEVYKMGEDMLAKVKNHQQ